MARTVLTREPETGKLREHLRLPSLRHSLIIRPDTPHVVRHSVRPPRRRACNIRINAG